MLGFACQRMWTFAIFYGIVAFSNASDVRSTLYGVQIISMYSCVVGAALLVIVARPGAQLSWAKSLVWVCSGLMSLGAVLCYFSDTQTGPGMLLTGLAGVTTGLGSGIMFVFWMRRFFGSGPRVTLMEYGSATALALLVDLLMTVVPFAVAFVVIAAAPIGGAVMMVRCMDDFDEAKDSPGPRLPTRRTVLSGSTKRLFAKALTGAFVIGGLQGLVDIISGYDTFTMSDMHGIILCLAGIAASLLMVVLAGLKRTGMLDSLYRASILLMALGYLLIPLMAGNYTYIAAIGFAGYWCFIVLVMLTAAYVSRSFMLGAMRTFAMALAALYLGEAVGLTVGGAVGHLVAGGVDLVVLSIVCTALLLFTHLYLFTESDLVRIGLGELDLVEDVCVGRASGTVGEDGEPLQGAPGHAGAEGAEAKAVESGSPDGAQGGQDPAESDTDALMRVADQMAKEYGLSPRESEVLPLLLRGRTMARIQDTLFISAGTVSTHVRHIYQKCGVANKQELLDLAFRKRPQ